MGENGEVLRQPLAANGAGATPGALEIRLPQGKVNAAIRPSRSVIGGLLQPDARRRVPAEERALAHVGEQYVSAPVARDVEARGSAGSRRVTLIGHAMVVVGSNPPSRKFATTLTVHPGARRIEPTLDTIDFRPGVTRANNAILGLFGTPAGNVTVASGFAVGTADLVIDATGWRR